MPDKIDPTESVEAEQDLMEQTDEKELDGPSEETLSNIEKILKDDEYNKGEDSFDISDDFPSDDNEQDEDSDDNADDGEGGDIPDEFTNAAKNAGWTTDQITEFASDYSNEQLLEMIPSLSENEESEQEDERDNEIKRLKQEIESLKKKPSEDEKDDNKDETKDEKSDEIVRLRKELNEIKESLSKVQSSKESESVNTMAKVADEFFDKASESFEVFGTTKDLPKFPNGKLISTSPEYKARAEVIKDAITFYQAGEKWNEALNSALDTYKGRYLEKDIEKRLIKKLKGEQKKLSPDRYNKFTEKKYKDETERQEDIVLQAARQAGLKKFD